MVGGHKKILITVATNAMTSTSTFTTEDQRQGRFY
jgi:hypothetical protein